MQKLKFVYISAVAIILLLITLSQIAIQYTLYEETVTRDLATQLSRQELRSQRILRNSLLLLTANPMDKTLNPLQVDPVAQLKDDLSFVEQTHNALTGNTPVASQMQALQADYQAMDDAGHAMLAAKAIGDRKSLVAQLTPMFVHEQKYLAGTFAVYTAVTQQADNLVNMVRILEISIFAFSLVVIGYEVFGVVLPAERARHNEITDLKKQVGLLQEALKIAKEQAIPQPSESSPTPESTPKEVL